MKTIIVEISPLGEVQIEALGFKGTACEKATQALEKALGIPVKKIKRPEYYAQTAGINQQRIGQ